MTVHICMGRFLQQVTRTKGYRTKYLFSTLNALVLLLLESTPAVHLGNAANSVPLPFPTSLWNVRVFFFFFSNYNLPTTISSLYFQDCFYLKKKKAADERKSLKVIFATNARNKVKLLKVHKIPKIFLNHTIHKNAYQFLLTQVFINDSLNYSKVVP